MSRPFRWEVTVPLPALDPFALGAPTTTAAAAGCASLLTFPLPYVLVEASAEGFFDPVDPRREACWEAARTQLAVAAGLAVSSSSPKLGLVAAGTPGVSHLRFRSRKGVKDGWHTGAPGSGLLAVGMALLRNGSLPHLLTTATNVLAWVIETPAGLRHVAYGTCPDGQAGLRLAVAVHLLEEIR